MYRIYFLCVLFIRVHSQSIHNIENLMNDFIQDEENMWKKIDYNEDNQTRDGIVKKILTFYEHYMSKSFEEIGIFQMISNELLDDYNHIIEHLVTVNDTFEHTFQLIKNNSYEDILKYSKVIMKMRLLRLSTYYLFHSYYMKTDFWSSIKNVIKLFFIVNFKLKI